MLRILAAVLLTTFAAPALAGPPAAPFASVDGGTISLADYAGRPVLLVNTASMCGFAPQFEGLQDVYDTYRDRGLVVLAVPSDDFRQELASGAEAKEYCELTYGIDMPMTDITHVTGAEAHPVYAWLRDEQGFEPGWNFNKVLFDGAGNVVGTWGAMTKPQSKAIIGAVEAALD